MLNVVARIAVGSVAVVALMAAVLIVGSAGADVTSQVGEPAAEALVVQR